MRTRYKHVCNTTKTGVEIGTRTDTCPICQTPVGWHKLKSGKNVRVALIEREGRWMMPAGAGNNFNFIKVHNCVEERSEKIARWQASVAEHKKTIENTTAQLAMFKPKGFARRDSILESSQGWRKSLAQVVRGLRKQKYIAQGQIHSLETLIEMEVPIATAFVDWSTKKPSEQPPIIRSHRRMGYTRE